MRCEHLAARTYEHRKTTGVAVKPVFLGNERTSTEKTTGMTLKPGFLGSSSSHAVLPLLPVGRRVEVDEPAVVGGAPLRPFC